ncbi:MAG: hypothetical protein HY517_01345 [Candidatus Aenigmarchaeota archaeon]|nr:hypothetical protein [Candidatus Aenigmarchaeota archaeon]
MRIIVEDVDEEILLRFRAWSNREGIPLGKAITMAMEEFLEQKEIAERIAERMEKGLYKLPENWKFNRDEIYDR